MHATQITSLWLVFAAIAMQWTKYKTDSKYDLMTAQDENYTTRWTICESHLWLLTNVNLIASNRKKMLDYMIHPLGTMTICTKSSLQFIKGVQIDYPLIVIGQYLLLIVWSGGPHKGHSKEQMQLKSETVSLYAV